MTNGKETVVQVSKEKVDVAQAFLFWLQNIIKDLDSKAQVGSPWQLTACLSSPATFSARAALLSVAMRFCSTRDHILCIFIMLSRILNGDARC